MELKPIKDIQLEGKETANQLVKNLYDAGRFTAKNVGIGVDILEKMNKEECTKILSFPACIISTGTRGVIKDLVKNKMVDAIVTTCGTIDHDLARVWRKYFHGAFEADDIQLHKENVFRLGNIFIPSDSYAGILEEKVNEITAKLYETKKHQAEQSSAGSQSSLGWSTRDLIWAFGEAIKDEEGAKDSIIYWAWKNQIPIFIPGPTDGAWGNHLWMFWQKHKDFAINLFEDEQELFNVVMDSKKTGAFIIGGGISKHHVIWWSQFKNGLDYVVYLTTAQEYDGSLSGAQTREAISWNKIKENADKVNIYGDATVILPLMISALMERLS